MYLSIYIYLMYLYINIYYMPTFINILFTETYRQKKLRNTIILDNLQHQQNLPAFQVLEVTV